MSVWCGAHFFAQDFMSDLLLQLYVLIRYTPPLKIAGTDTVILRASLSDDQTQCLSSPQWPGIMLGPVRGWGDDPGGRFPP